MAVAMGGEAGAREEQKEDEAVVVAGYALGGGIGALLGAGSGDEEEKVVVNSPDTQIVVRQLRGRGALSSEEMVLDDEADIALATGGGDGEETLDMEAFLARLGRVHQLTGFGDPVYAEAVVTVHDYDILLDITVLNRGDTTLTNLSVELACLGDLKLVERPQSFTVGPHGTVRVAAHIKVSSTETGHIFGTLTYTSSGAPADTRVVNLNDIHVDIMDYIHAGYCDPTAFRSMWAEFEWENKVAVNTNITSLQQFVAHVAKITNMRILTPTRALTGSANFLAANLYARSVFGEDALMNVSVENRRDGSIRGHIRIRSKTQGVALSMGDRITAKQKE